MMAHASGGQNLDLEDFQWLSDVWNGRGVARPKNGSPTPKGDGPFGSGSACLFGGTVFGG